MWESFGYIGGDSDLEWGYESLLEDCLERLEKQRLKIVALENELIEAKNQLSAKEIHILDDCPFCGSSNIQVEYDVGGISEWFVQCKFCTVCIDGFNSRSDACNAWNTRT